MADSRAWIIPELVQDGGHQHPWRADQPPALREGVPHYVVIDTLEGVIQVNMSPD